MTKKQEWCRMFGTSCKNKDCKYEHLKEFPGVCNGIKDLINNRFVMCELEPNHKGDCKALGRNFTDWE